MGYAPADGDSFNFISFRVIAFFCLTKPRLSIASYHFNQCTPVMEILSALGDTYVCRGLPALALGDHFAHDRDIRVWEYWPARHFVFTSHIHPLTTARPGEAKETYSLIQAAELHPILPGLHFAKQVPLILTPNAADQMERVQLKSYRDMTYRFSGERTRIV